VAALQWAKVAELSASGRPLRNLPSELAPDVLVNERNGVADAAGRAQLRDRSPHCRAALIHAALRLRRLAGSGRRDIGETHRKMMANSSEITRWR